MSSKISKQRYLALMQRVLDHIADKQDLVSYHDVFCALKEKGILLTRGDSVCLNVFLNTQGEALQIREFLTSKESFDKDYSQIEGIFPVTGENSGKYVFSDKEMKNVVSNFFFMLHLESAGIDAKEVGIRQVFGKFSSAVAATGSRILCQ